MRRFLCAVGFSLIAFPAAGQFTGTYQGTINIADECDAPLNYSTPGTVAINQSAGTLVGTMAVAIQFCEGGTFQIVIPFAGQASGNSFTADAIVPFAVGTVTGSLSGNTLTFSATFDGPPGISATLTRTSTAPPDSRLTGSASGSFTFSQMCSNGNFNSSGTVSGALIQAGSAIGGIVILMAPDIEEDPMSGACHIGTEQFALPALVSAVISGSSVTGSLIIPAEDVENDDDDVIPFTGTISGNTISGSSTEMGVSFTLNVTPGASPPTITRFDAAPSSIAMGQSSTLTWTTVNADSVTIDNGIGTKAASGSVTVSPGVTTTYTLTANGPAGSATAMTTVTVTGAAPARIALTALPRGMVQAANVASATDTFTLTNLGGSSGSVTLTQSGSFFTQTPTTFTIGAGSSQVVVIRATAQPPGPFEGNSITNTGITIPIRLAVAAPPTAPVVPSADNSRPDTTPLPPDQNPSGTVSITNSGAGVLQGSATADVAWLIPQTGLITIQPGQSQSISFTTNRALRPDSDALQGGQIAKFSLNYLDFPGSASSPGFSASQASPSSSTTNTVSVSIVDVVKTNVSTGDPGLGSGEQIIFAPGLPQRSNSFGDLLVGATGTNTIGDLKLVFNSQGTSPLATSALSLIPNTGLSFPSILKNVFSTLAQSGTVQIRSTNANRISVAAIQTNTASRVGSYITALPTFRSDASIGVGSKIVLAGVEKGSTRSTNLYIQEMSGSSGSVQIDFLGANGNVVASRPADSMSAFSLLELTDAVPAGASAVRINNASGNAKIAAYALVMDAITQDAWLITDSSLGTSTTNLVVPVIPGPSGATTQTDLFVVNPGSSPLTVTFDTIAGGTTRRRAARTATTAGNTLRLESNVTTNLTIPANQMMTARVTTNSGFVRVSAPSTFSISGRSTLTAAGRFGSFGSALPAIEAAAGLSNGQSRRFAGIDDASQRTIDLRTPVTYRSTLGLVESSGQSAVVRVTLRYAFSAGTRTTALGVSSKDINVPANQLVFVGDLSKTIIGATRSTFGDLRNMQLDVEVISGNGKVIPFLATVDNGSGDMSIRSE